MPRQLRKVQAFPEMPRDFRKCLISAIPCDIHIHKEAAYRAVVLNRGAAEPLGAAESSRGAANF